MDRPVPASFWRGGTSRAVLFLESDLAGYDPDQVEAVILAALGSPDPGGRQVDGLGGGSSSLSKAAIVGAAPAGSAADVAFRFAQVEVAAPRVDFTGNCGNISAAIGPFALEAGLVAARGHPADGPVDVDLPVEVPVDGPVDVTVLSLNTGQRYRARVPTRSGRYEPAGDFCIPGVPGRGSRIAIEYIDPAGSAGRGPFPTGAAREEIDIGGGPVVVSIVDVGNPVVFVEAAALGADIAASPDEIDADRSLHHRLERVRREAAVRIGAAGSAEEAAGCPTIPKVAMVGPPSGAADGGRPVPAEGIDVAVRLVSMGRAHRTVAVTGAMAAAAAAALPGTVVAEAAGAGAAEDGVAEDGPRPVRTVRIGHPAGVLEVGVEVGRGPDGQWRVPRVTVDRTAREIMRGSVCVPESYLAGQAWFAGSGRR